MELSLAGRAWSPPWNSVSERGWERMRLCLCRRQVVGGSGLVQTGIFHVLSLWKGNFIALLQTCFILQTLPCLSSPAGCLGGRSWALCSSEAQSSGLVHEDNVFLLCPSDLNKSPFFPRLFPPGLRTPFLSLQSRNICEVSWPGWKHWQSVCPFGGRFTTGDPSPSLLLLVIPLAASPEDSFEPWRQTLQYYLYSWEPWAGHCIFLIIMHWGICLEITDSPLTSVIWS